MKPKFGRFQGQFDLVDQGYQLIHGSSLKVKFKTLPKLSHSQGITQDDNGTNNNTSLPGRGGLDKSIMVGGGGGGRQIHNDLVNNITVDKARSRG